MLFTSRASSYLTGHHPREGKMKPCNECAGTGEIMDMEVRQHGRFHRQWTICATCGSTGYTPEPLPATLLIQTGHFDAPVIVERFAAEGGAQCRRHDAIC